MTEQAYVSAIRSFYLQLPNTHRSFSRSDRQLAIDLYNRPVSFETVRSAMLLASARRIFRDPAAHPLSHVRSLHYFLPLINEILAQPLPKGYIEYVEFKLAQCKLQTSLENR